MERLWYVINYSLLMACVFVLMDHNVYGCLEGGSSVSPKSFLFISVPSVNATLGEKVELKCSVNRTNSSQILNNIVIHSRMVGLLNATCNIFDSSSGECSYTIPKVELRHRGSYDCIKFYEDFDCFSRTLDLSVLDPPRLAIVTLRTLHFTTNKVSKNQEGTYTTCEATRTVTRHWKETFFILTVLGVLLF